MRTLLNLRSWQLSVISGLLIGLSFHPPLHMGFLIWVGFVPLIHIILTSGPRRAAKYAYYASVLANFIAFHWIGLNNGATIGPVLLSLLGAVLYLGIFWYVIGYIAVSVAPIISPLFFLPIGWSAMEWVRSLGPLGFPWANLALSQTNYLPLIQIADITGSYGITFWILMINAGIYLIITEKRPKRYIAFTSALFVFTALYGFFRISVLESEPIYKRVEIAVTQPNIDPNEKWDRENKTMVYQLMDSLHVVANELSPDLILWPETALPTYLRLSRSTRNKIMKRIQSYNIPLLSGTVDRRVNQDGETEYFNGSIYLKENGSFEMYNKVLLVPFAEYIPFTKKFPILKKLNFGQGNFTQGTDYTVFNLDSIRFSNVICYESSIPGVVRKFINQGAQFITIEANDGYLGNSAGPYQHFALAKLRSVENRVPIVRSANTGISGAFNVVGRVQHQVPIGETAVFLARIDCIYIDSIYTRFGDVFAVLCLVITLIVLGATLWQHFSV